MPRSFSFALALKELSQHFPTQSKGQGHFGRDGAAMVVLLLAFDLRNESHYFPLLINFYEIFEHYLG